MSKKDWISYIAYVGVVTVFMIAIVLVLMYIRVALDCSAFASVPITQVPARCVSSYTGGN